MLYSHNFRDKYLNPILCLSHAILACQPPCCEVSYLWAGRPWQLLHLQTAIILRSHPLHVTSFFLACTIPSGKHGHGSPNTVNLDYPHHGTRNLVAIESVKTTIRIISQSSGSPPASTVNNHTLICTGTIKNIWHLLINFVGNISAKEYIRPHLESQSDASFHSLNNTYLNVFMTALSHHGSVPECLTGCNIPTKSTLPVESTHRGSPQRRGSLPNGTQRKRPE